MKRFTKVICIILVIAAVLVVPVSAETEMEATPRASLFFAITSTYLYQTTATKFQVWFDVAAVDGMDKLGTSSIKVQRSSDGENWKTMFTYLPEYYPQMIDTDTCEHGSYVPYTGTQGYYYRAYVTFYAKNSTGTGELSRYTETIKL